ncbi:MAG TPA: type II secretion system F family protein [Polyangiaceae bacterium]|nr:type II secretion system F family protein [Polyangiaceae bacterium]
MRLPYSVETLEYFGLALTFSGLLLGSRAALAPGSGARRAYRAYTAELDRKLAASFLCGSGPRIAALQLALGVGVVTLGLGLAMPYGCVALGPLALAPNWYLDRKRRIHISSIEAQIDGFILGLANALKSVASPAAAIAQLGPALPLPMRLEVDKVNREVRLGSSLDRALLNLSSRLRSSEVDTALSAVLIGLQIGGNLPSVLESTAATLREMKRLDGVIRTKTAEGRAQLWVLALFPFVICLGFSAVDEQYFTPLRHGWLGSGLVCLGLGLWLVSLLLARQILKVEL